MLVVYSKREECWKGGEAHLEVVGNVVIFAAWTGEHAWVCVGGCGGFGLVGWRCLGVLLRVALRRWLVFGGGRHRDVCEFDLCTGGCRNDEVDIGFTQR